MSPIYVYNPIEKDALSRFRGLGRYLEIMRSAFSNKFHFVTNLRKIPYNSVFINPFFDPLQQPLTLQRIAKKQVAVIHDIIPLKYPKHFPIGMRGKVYKLLNKIALKQYDLIITDSHASKESLSKILNLHTQNISVVYPPLSESFSQLEKNKEVLNNLPSKFCLYVGDATWNKNLINLAKAVQIINISCVVVGKVFKTTNNLNHPWQQELKEFLKITKGDKRFIFTGFISNHELKILYQKAALNVLVSRDEGFGFSYLEAASQKTPSVLADIPVFHETAQNTALFANPNDPNDIANQIGELYFHPQLTQELGKKSYQRSKNFTSKKFKKDFQDALLLIQ